jgi:hypothetical protein
MGKKRSGPAMFAGLTVKEADVLRSVLTSGADVAAHVSARNHDLFMETHAAMDDIGEARRQRWNRENPGYRIGR